MKYPKLRVVLMNGPSKSGKDTIVDAFVHKYRVLGIIQPGDPSFVAEKMKFAAPIKRAQAAFFDMSEDELDIEKDNPILPGHVMPRTGLIRLSEIWAKPLFGPTVFGDILRNDIRSGMKNDPPTGYIRLVLVSDSGFEPEAQSLVDEFKESVHIVKVWRHGATFVGDSRAYLPDDFISPWNIWGIDNNDRVEDAVHVLEKIVRGILVK